MTDALVTLLDFSPATWSVPLQEARPRHLRTKLCKFGRSTSPTNNVGIKNRTHLNLGLLSVSADFDRFRVVELSTMENMSLNMTAKLHRLGSHHYV